MEVQNPYKEAILFASTKHMEQEQFVPGTDLPYVLHLSMVAMEIMIASSNTDHFNIGFAIQVALLHDTLEDTSTKIEELENKFGVDVAKAVSALTKNKDLPHEKQMQDSLKRIKDLPSEVWAVKLADRIINLQPPTAHWDNQKRIKYQNEAKTILGELKDGNKFLATRLEVAILEYGNYINN